MLQKLRADFGIGDELVSDKALLTRDAIRYSPRVIKTIRRTFQLVAPRAFGLYAGRVAGISSPSTPPNVSPA